MDLWTTPVKGFLLDITGVLYDSSPTCAGRAIPGSINAIKRESQLRFITNENSCSRDHLVAKLAKLGFSIQKEHVFMPAPVAKQYLKQYSILMQFSDVNTENPNCVLMGDAEDNFTYENMNAAFRVLDSLDKPLIVTLGCGKFYQRIDGPSLDVGGFARALQYVSGAEIVTIGKPDEKFFAAAIENMGLTKRDVVMIGDDIVSDVGGAQKIGIRAVQVRTGKWRPSWEKHEIKPNLISDSLETAVETILQRNKS